MDRPSDAAGRPVRRAPHRLTIAWLTAALAAGCWIDPATRELQPSDGSAAARDPRRPTPRVPRPVGERPGPGQTLEAPDAVGSLPERPALALLPGGLRVVFAPGPARVSHLRLTIRHRGLAAHDVAVARVLAEYLADAPLEDGSRPSLRLAIHNLGGRLDVAVDPRTTRFTVRAPADAWPRVVELFGQTLEVAPTSNERVAEARDQVLRDLTAEIGDDPLANAVERVRSVEFEGVSAWLAAAEDVTLGQVAAFWRRAYRSDVAVLALQAADAPPQRILRTVDERFARWVGDARELLPAVVELPPPAGGMFWAAGPEPAQAAVVLTPLPLSTPRAALEWIAIECLTADGVGGRIGLAIEDEVATDTPLTPRLVDEGSTLRLELRGSLPSWAVRPLDAALRAAFRSMAQDPPGDELVRRAAARARLRLATALHAPETWLAWATHSAYTGLMPTLQWTGSQMKPLDLPGGDPWRDSFAVFADVDRRQLAEVFRSFADRQSLLVVAGGNPDPAQPTDTFARISDAFVPLGRQTVVTADEAAQIAAAEGLRDRALAAVGGVQLLPLVRGLSLRGLTESGRGPEMVTESYYSADGRLRRLTRILETEIETVVLPDQGYDSVAGRRIALSPTERASALAEYERHPLMLLSAWMQGRAAYRLLSLREVQGREMAILERTRGGQGRLRMHVDTGSGLVRAVESEDLREIGVVFLREEYRDYRTSDVGVRIPHQRVTWVDDGLRGLLTTWTVAQPTEPTADRFEPAQPR